MKIVFSVVLLVVLAFLGINQVTINTRQNETLIRQNKELLEVVAQWEQINRKNEATINSLQGTAIECIGMLKRPTVTDRRIGDQR